jgi:hypothetical protein
MPEITMHMDGDGCWPDLKDLKKKNRLFHGEIVSAAYLQSGTVQGDHTVSLRIRLDDGSTVIAETTLRLFMTMAAAFHGKAQRDGVHDIWQGPAAR